jgi:cytochrome c553
MEDIAAYYAEQTVTETFIPASIEYKQVELGETIYRAGDADSKLPACMACHGPGAAGNPASMYPSLSGQHAAYTAAQLQVFKTETRNNDTNSVMRDIARKLSNEEIEAVSQYIQGLH